jgi:hypothetical protein
MTRNWVAVASAEHVRIGRTKGFMQVCHGKAAPLRRIQPGDGVVYYSPTTAFGGKDRLQSFTAIGVVNDGVPYQADTGGGFSPFRRDVNWSDAEETPIKPLVGRLHFTTAKRNWGFQLRFGLFEISGHDMAMIAEAMGVSPSFPNQQQVRDAKHPPETNENAEISDHPNEADDHQCDRLERP